MTASLAKSVPTAVVPSAQNTVPVLTEAQLGPYQPMTGSAVIPVVPRSDEQAEKGLPAQPGYGGYAEQGSQYSAGSDGSPSVPSMNGILFRKGPVDSHYTSEYQGRDPYGKVNNPSTRGMFTWVKDYLNHIAFSQHTDTTGFEVNGDQQRTSFMRVTPPPHADGYSPQSYVPRQMPQAVAYNRYRPVTGTDRYGTGVLNSDTYGAGQTAGGIGGNRYTPVPGPPETVSTAGQQSDHTGMPVWG